MATRSKEAVIFPINHLYKWGFFIIAKKTLSFLIKKIIWSNSKHIGIAPTTTFHNIRRVLKQRNWKRDYLIVGVPALKFLKKLNLHRTDLTKNTSLLILLDMVHFKYLPKGCPYICMYSAFHIMQWFSRNLDVKTPKIRRFFFRIFQDQNKPSPTQDLEWSLAQCTCMVM